MYCDMMSMTTCNTRFNSNDMCCFFQSLHDLVLALYLEYLARDTVVKSSRDILDHGYTICDKKNKTLTGISIARTVETSQSYLHHLTLADYLNTSEEQHR
jgi:hypothetical protein